MRSREADSALFYGLFSIFTMAVMYADVFVYKTYALLMFPIIVPIFIFSIIAFISCIQNIGNKTEET